MNQAINTCITGLNNIGQGFWDYAVSIFVQSSVLIVLLLIIDFVLRKRVRAVFRYCVWMLVFVKLILPTSFALPTGIGYWLADYWPTETSVSEQKPTPAVEQAVPAAVPEQRQVVTLEPAVINETVPAEVKLEPICWQGLVFLGWLAGVLVFSALLIQRAWFVKALVAQSKPAKGRLLGTLNECRSQIGIRKTIELRLSDNMASPAVCGLFKPMILMPTTLLEKLSLEKLKAVLIHELAHIKRRDIWVNVVQTVLQIVYFYNPLLWLANAMVRRVREQAVDEMVLVALGAEADSYSNTLIDIGEMVFWQPNLSLRVIGVVESKSSLKERIKIMLNRPIPKSAKLGAAGLIAVIIIGAILLPMARADRKDTDGSDYSILMLDNSDPDYKGKEQYDDRLYLLDSSGKVNGVVSGFNICETAGGNHKLAVDEERKTLWVAENVGARLWHFDLGTGKLLRRIQGLKASALAVDPATGNVWVMLSGSIGKGHIKVISPSGEIKAEYNIPGFDITYSKRDKSFWVVGRSVYKLDRTGKILGQIVDQIPHMASSVSIDQKTGNAWVLVRAHLQVPESKPELWVVERNVEIKRRIDLGELIPFCVSVDSDKGVVWVGCLSTVLRFRTNGDKLKSARQVSGFSVVPGPSVDSVFAASRWGVGKAMIEESGYVSFFDIAENIKDELGSGQKWLAIAPFAGAKLQTPPDLTYLTLRKTLAERRSAPLGPSQEKLRKLGVALFMYANDHEEKYPDTLGELKLYVGDERNFQWLLDNVEYLAKGKTVVDHPNTMIAYDKTLLEKGNGTNVLFNDSHVEFVKPNQLAELGIIASKKPDVQVEGESEVSNLVEQLQSESRRERCQAALKLEKLGDRRGVPAIIKELKDTSYKPTGYSAMAINPPYEQNRQESWVRQDHYYAALLLGILGDKRAVPALIEATRDETIDYQAALSLGQIGDKQAIPALRVMLERCSNKPFPRLFAGYGLAMLGDNEGLKVVIETLNNQQVHWTNRRHAIEALGKLGDKEAVPHLITALKDEHPNIRVSAAKALGAIGDPSALPALKQALEDKTATKVNAPTTVSEAAAKAIAQFEGETIAEQLLPEPEEMTIDSLADICKRMESAFHDITVEYEWYDEPSPRVSDIIGTSKLIYRGPRKCKLSAARPFFWKFRFFETGTVMNDTDDSWQFTKESSYNGRISKQLSIGGFPQSIKVGTIRKRMSFVPYPPRTALGFSILRLGMEDADIMTTLETLRYNLETLRYKELVHLLNKIEKINGFDTIRADFLNPNKQIYLHIYFSVEHGYTPVRWEYIMHGSKMVFSVEVKSLQKVADGLWFPSSGVVNNHDKSKSVYKAIGNIVINQGLREEDFDVEFPTGTQVDDQVRGIKYIVTSTEVKNQKTAVQVEGEKR